MANPVTEDTTFDDALSEFEEELECLESKLQDEQASADEIEELKNSKASHKPKRKG